MRLRRKRRVTVLDRRCSRKTLQSRRADSTTGNSCTGLKDIEPGAARDGRAARITSGNSTTMYRQMVSGCRSMHQHRGPDVTTAKPRQIILKVAILQGRGGQVRPGSAPEPHSRVEGASRGWPFAHSESPRRGEYRIERASCLNETTYPISRAARDTGGAIQKARELSGAASAGASYNGTRSPAVRARPTAAPGIWRISGNRVQ